MRESTVEIVVCVARVVDLTQPLSARSGALESQGEPLRYCLNTADQGALEEALRIKDRVPGARVTAVSLGPPECEPFLRACLTAGADEALLLSDPAFEGGDTLATARVLSRAAQRLGADLVLCGREATDGATGQTPLQIGELMGAATVSGVVHLELADDLSKVTVHRKLERGYRAVLRCPLPAVLALEPGIAPLRYSRLRDRFRAQKAPIQRWGCEQLGLSPGEAGEQGSCVHVLAIGPARPDTRGLFAPEAGLSGMERWQAVISGGLGGRQSPLVEGPPAAQAEQLLAFLSSRGLALTQGG
jgi:electron transfer flavoprotein beta subunit